MHNIVIEIASTKIEFHAKLGAVARIHHKNTTRRYPHLLQVPAPDRQPALLADDECPKVTVLCRWRPRCTDVQVTLYAGQRLANPHRVADKDGWNSPEL